MSLVFQNKIGNGRHFPADVWGPSYWDFLHFSSLVYRPAQRRYWKMLLKSFLPCALPCERCRSHYINEIRSMTDNKWRRILSTRNELVYYLFSLHNKINKRLGKRLFSPMQFIAKYESFRN